MNHAESAEKLFYEKYNCSQAVVCAFSDLTGLDEKTALAISSSFGGGFGRMREVCGTVSGACMVLGLLFGGYTPGDNAAKAAHYALIQDFMARFKARAGGSYICRELLGEAQVGGAPSERTPDFYKKRPCPKLVYLAAKIVDEILIEKGYTNV